jgi:hypothetical protein
MGSHSRLTVRLLEVGGIKFPSIVSARLTPAWWREPKVGMDPTLLLIEEIAYGEG